MGLRCGLPAGDCGVAQVMRCMQHEASISKALSIGFTGFRPFTDFTGHSRVLHGTFTDFTGDSRISRVIHGSDIHGFHGHIGLEALYLYSHMHAAGICSYAVNSHCRNSCSRERELGDRLSL